MLLMIWCMSVLHAQPFPTRQDEFKPGISLAINVSQWTVGQHQLEIEQRFKNTPYALSFQLFGGDFDRRLTYINGSDRDTLFGVSTLGLGLGIRRYENNESRGFYSQFSVFYKDVNKTYSRIDVEDRFFEPPLFFTQKSTYYQATDRLTGLGAELLGGYRYTHDMLFVEAHGGVVARFLQPQGNYLGALSPWRFYAFTNVSPINLLFALRVGVQL